MKALSTPPPCGSLSVKSKPVHWFLLTRDSHFISSHSSFLISHDWVLSHNVLAEGQESLECLSDNALGANIQSLIDTLRASRAKFTPLHTKVISRVNLSYLGGFMIEDKSKESNVQYSYSEFYHTYIKGKTASIY